MKGLLDSGSSRTIVNLDGAKYLKDAGLNLQPSRHGCISVANSTSAEIKGVFTVPFKVNAVMRVLEVLYVPSLSTELLLGVDFWRRFDLRPDLVRGTCEVASVEVCEGPFSNQKEDENESVLTEEQKRELEQILQNYPNVFDSENLGCARGIYHHIDTGDAPPVKQSYNSLNPLLLHEVHEELDQRLRKKLVEPSDSPYSSPLLRLKKKDGKGTRWVVDFRKLNENIKTPNAYQLPKINGLLMNIGSAAIISSIDIRDAYLQVELDPESRKKTAFFVPGRGLYQFTRMPAGLKDAAGRWQGYIERVLGYHPNIVIYMDDLLLWSPNGDWDHHKELLKYVLERLSAAGITANLEKSVFGRRQTLYLGHIIDQHGVRPNPKSVSAVMNFPVPKNVKQVRQFLGLAGWMRRFVRNFSGMARPLIDLTKKGEAFVWTEKHDQAFQDLKQHLCSAPVLRSPDFTRPFKVYTDGSAIGTGGVLVQEVDGTEHVIAYTSKSLTSYEEKNYSATELECLAVLHAINAFRPYLEGYHFEIVTDHSSLKWLVNLKNPKGRLARWAIELQAYDFKVIHRPGSKMQGPDALSRNPVVDLIDLPRVVEDPWYLDLKKRVEEEPDSYERFAIRGNLLFKLIAVGNFQPLKWVQVLPKECREAALQDAHDAPTSGHCGNFKTFQRLRRNAYWPKMRKEMEEYVKSCTVCQEQKVERTKPPGLMGSSPKVTLPFEVLSTDLIVQLPRSTKGNTCLLVTVDLFSKFVFLKPLRDAKTRPMLEHFERDIFLNFGCPRVILSDNGPQYRSKEFRRLCEKYHIELKSTIRYNPRSNPTERYNQTIEGMIRSFTGDNQRHWDQYIPEIQSALRSNVNEITGFTPQFLVYGSELCLDGRERLYDGKARDIPEVEAPGSFVQSASNRRSFFEEIAERMKFANQTNATRYNLRRRVVQLPEGTLVLRKNFVLSNAQKAFSAKLAPRWIGPFKVKKKVGNVSYLLEDPEKKKEDGVWHIEQLKRYYPRTSRETRYSKLGGNL